MYDKRKPFQIIENALTFSFQATNYQIWSNGEMIDNGNISSVIRCQPAFNSLAVSEIKLFNIPDKLNVNNTLIFDLTYTSSDRILLATIPETTNLNNYNNFLAFKQYAPIGFPIITRAERNFEEDEPYACSIFTINNKIEKITFTFGNKPRLLEFYQ